MTENNSDNIQYNSCISKGICSVNPRTSALQNVLGFYLSLCAKYCLKLFQKNELKESIKDFILNTVAVSVSNPEFTENCFMEAIERLRTILPEIVEKYNKLYEEKDFEGENISESKIFQKCGNIIDAIKFGEEIFQAHVKNIPAETRELFKIMLIVSRSISLNILDLESYGVSCGEEFEELLTILNSVNSQNTDTGNIKRELYKGAKCNTCLIIRLHEEQEKRYGKQKIVRVSYTTTPSKAVLAVGSNIRELETILETLKDTDIDVYTHDDMMVAHTFPKFGEYSNLKGQYGHGLENCLIDFATFPGPIILTKHSLHNIENLYRGRLFTTDINFYKGVIRIENNDYGAVIESANQAKGFKRGKVCETVTIGYEYEKTAEEIREKLGTGRYKKVVVIGLKDYSSERKDYFSKLVRYISDDILIVSFSYNFERENLLCINACFDSFAVVKIVTYILNLGFPLDVFLPKCGRNTITEMIHFSGAEKTSVYAGECEPIMINPYMRKVLEKNFNIKSIGSAKKDSENVNKLSND